MTSSIEPPRRSPPVRKTSKVDRAAPADDEDEGVEAAEPAHLPVPVSPARTIPPKTPVASAAAIEAQLIGERRGLRAGASVIDQAKVTYNKTEWSGSKDRRTPKGRAAKTDV
ncbi:hypothetical protein [Phenylobacterium sp.]|uniref:hypothetical protein n=1 Tax=Phenylobacterium sp. TaxID=1871053 RepID=UPI001225B81E|nr:hypothetical protein [Phenylobacterium sp.]THD60551.1 MAG: hypothetical protein E8A49_14080 [Phenylobacterium sp.]